MPGDRPILRRSEIGGSPLALNIGRDLPGGLPYQPWAAELVKQRFSKDDPHVRCLPDNPPRTWGMPHLTKAVHTPRLLVLLYEVNAMYRQIFIDGRPQPDDPNPSWNGYSTAAWDRDTLVIRTTGFRDDLWIDMNGAPMTSTATMTERLRRPNYGTLEVEITVDDPKVYTRPWTVSMNQEVMLDTELIDEICLENEKSWQHMQTPNRPSSAPKTKKLLTGTILCVHTLCCVGYACLSMLHEPGCPRKSSPGIATRLPRVGCPGQTSLRVSRIRAE